jgi:hypothetical protein
LDVVTVRVEPGEVLGPFPAGTHRFVVHRGPLVLATVSAVVEAGRVVPLVVPD